MKSDKYHMISLVCGILKTDMNELIYKTDSGIENKFVVSKGENAGGSGWERNSELEVNIYTVLYIK